MLTTYTAPDIYTSTACVQHVVICASDCVCLALKLLVVVTPHHRALCVIIDAVYKLSCLHVVHDRHVWVHGT